MTLAPKRRHALIGGGLLITVALVAWSSTLDVSTPEVIEPLARITSVPQEAEQQSSESSSPAVQTPGLPEREPITPGTAFTPKSWFVAPPRPAPTSEAAKEAPKPRPSAPPLPYAYIGTITLADGSEIMHFTKGTELRTAQLGQALDEQYRLEGRDGDSIVFTYLPLSQRQYLALNKD